MSARSGRRPIRYSMTPPPSTPSPQQSPSNTVEDSPQQGQSVFRASGRTIYSPDARRHKSDEDYVKPSKSALRNLSLLEMFLNHKWKEYSTTTFHWQGAVHLEGYLIDDSGESVTIPHGLISGSHELMSVEDLNKAVDDLFNTCIDTTDCITEE